VTCPDAFCREPWDRNDPHPLCSPSPTRAGEGGRGRGRTFSPTADAVGYILMPLRGSFFGSEQAGAQFARWRITLRSFLLQAAEFKNNVATQSRRV